MHIKGERYEHGASSWPEGALFRPERNPPEVGLFVRPSKGALQSISRARVELGLVVELPVVVLLVHVGRAVDWWAAPFSWHLVDPEIERGTARIGGRFDLVTVSAETGVVAGIRSLEATRAFSRALTDAIASQAKAPWDGVRYVLTLTELQRRCATGRAWRHRASAHCRCRDA